MHHILKFIFYLIGWVIILPFTFFIFIVALLLWDGKYLLILDELEHRYKQTFYWKDSRVKNN